MTADEWDIVSLEVSLDVDAYLDRIDHPRVPPSADARWTLPERVEQGLVPMTTVALRSSDLATRGISPLRATVSTVSGAWRSLVSTSR